MSWRLDSLQFYVAPPSKVSHAFITDQLSILCCEVPSNIFFDLLRAQFGLMPAPALRCTRRRDEEEEEEEEQ